MVYLIVILHVQCAVSSLERTKLATGKRMREGVRVADRFRNRQECSRLKRARGSLEPVLETKGRRDSEAGYRGEKAPRGGW